MGVKINELVQNVKRTITFENIFNKRIAIDAFNTIYQFLAIIRQRDGTPLKDYEGNVTSHLSGLFYRSIDDKGEVKKHPKALQEAYDAGQKLVTQS